jgi:hypothetical protein
MQFKKRIFYPKRYPPGIAGESPQAREYSLLGEVSGAKIPNRFNLGTGSRIVSLSGQDPESLCSRDKACTGKPARGGQINKTIRDKDVSKRF